MDIKSIGVLHCIPQRLDLDAVHSISDSRYSTINNILFGVYSFAAMRSIESGVLIWKLCSSGMIIIR